MDIIVMEQSAKQSDRDYAINMCVKVIQKEKDQYLLSMVDCVALLDWYDSIDAGVRAELNSDVSLLKAALGYENKYLSFTTKSCQES